MRRISALQRTAVVVVALAAAATGACSSDDGASGESAKASKEMTEACGRVEGVAEELEQARTLSAPFDEFVDDLEEIAGGLGGTADALEEDLRTAIEGLQDTIDGQREGSNDIDASTLANARIAHGFSGVSITCAEAGNPVTITF
jgi:hypothetical protein